MITRWEVNMKIRDEKKTATKKLIGQKPKKVD
jgi:hypothetical protein